MGDMGLAPELEHFISNRIDSVELLEVLLNLQKDPHGEVSVESLSRVLYSSPASIRLRLDKLVALGLAILMAGKEGLYRYAPENQADDQMIAKLARAYYERPVAVIAAIMSRPAKNVQAFSDAFLFRRGGNST